MNLEQLTERLSFLNNPANGEPITLSMYILLKDGTIRLANLEEESREELQQRFLDYLQSRLGDTETLNYCPLTEHTDRKNTVCYYDLDEIPEGLKVMNEILENEEQDDFSASEDGFEDIVGFVFLIGHATNKVALYKHHHWLSVIKQDSKFMGFGKSDTELVRIKTDILKVSDKFDFLQVDDSLIVFSTRTLESNFGYRGILEGAARSRFELIDEAELIENIEELEELIAEKRYAKKLVAIKADTPVLALPFSRLRDFILDHPKLKRRIKFNDANDKIKFHSKKSKELFLDLLTDSFLKSELTELLYHSSNKEALTTDEEGD